MGCRMDWKSLIVPANSDKPSLSRMSVLLAQVSAAVMFVAWNIELMVRANGELPSGLVELWLVYTAVAGVQYNLRNYIAYKEATSGGTKSAPVGDSSTGTGASGPVSG